MLTRFGVVLVCISLVSTSAPSLAQAAKSGVSPGVISLPKGPGSVSGMGESFQPDLNTGSMTYRVPMKVPSGVGGLTPSVALSYSSGGGNSEVGFGWSLGTPRIQIRTEKGLPRYDGTDIFTISGVGSGELVPLADGFYRLEIEGAYIRAQQGANGWEVRDKSGKIYRFGYTTESRCEGSGGRVFAWYLTDQYDTLGNHIEYLYEQHGGLPYLRHVRYNNFSSDVVAEVEFTYEARADALDSYRTGFKVTQGRRLIRVESSVGGQLLARYSLEYEADNALSRLSRVTMVGTDGETGLPPLTLSYYGFDPAASELVTMATPPGVSPGLADNALADVNGDSFPDLLLTSSGNFEYYLNDGGTGWAPRDSLPLSPSLALSYNGVQLSDVDGDGRIDLLAKLGPGVGDFRYYPADDTVGFATSVPLSNNPDFSFEDPEVRLFDVTGDGRADVVRTTVGELLVYENLGGGSYADGQVLPEIAAGMQVMFSDTTQVRLANMNGDGLIDVAYLRSDSVVYWPQMGGGRFDTAVIMGNAPALPDMTIVKLRDLNGDGLGDLVRVGVNQVEYWLNQGDGTYGALQTIVDTPYRDPINTTVEFADMNGNGSTDIVWIDVTGSPDEAWQYLDVMGSNRPGLLHEAANGLGQVLRAEYSSSGDMSALARRDGDPWSIEQPVPTQVLSRLTVSDSLGPDMVTELEYRDGHYNGEEREFRGFGETRQREVGDAHTPTLVTTMEYDVGWSEEARKGIVLRLRKEDENGRVFRISDATYDVVPLATGTDGRTVRAARRRDEIISIFEGTSTPRVLLTEYAWDDWGNPSAKYEWGEVIAGDPLEGSDERITLSEYAINAEDWILNRISEQRVQNAQGETLRWERSYYDGPDYDGLPLGQLSHGYLKRHDVWLGASEDRWISKRRLAHDDWGNTVSILGPLGLEQQIDYDPVSHRFPIAERALLESRTIASTAEYDQVLGVLIRYADPNGQVSQWSWDPLGRPVAVILPGDSDAYPTKTYTYELGSPISAIRVHQRVYPGEPETLSHVIYYDGLSRLRSRRQKAENDQWLETEAVSLDARGAKHRIYRPRFVPNDAFESPEDTLPHVETYHDALGRMVEQIKVDGATVRRVYLPLTTLEYDEIDSDVDSPHADTPTRLVNDGLGRLIRVDRDAGALGIHSTRFDWNVAGDLLAIVDAEGHRRSYRYDGLGRRTATTDPDAGEWAYEHDDNGREVERRNPLGERIRRSYDLAGRMLRETQVDAGGVEETIAEYHYDTPWQQDLELRNVVGRLAWIESPLKTEAFGYNPRGKTAIALRILDGTRYSVRYEHDSADRMSEIEYPDGTRLRYTYNERSKVSRAGGIVLDQRYGAEGELLSRTFGNGVVANRTYDERRRLNTLRSNAADGSVLQDLTIQYDAKGNVTQVADRRTGISSAQDRSVTARHDALDRLVSATGNGFDLTWEYSSSGNILAVSGTFEALPEKLTLGQFHYGTAQSGPHRLARVVTPGGQELTFEHNEAGRLVRTPELTLTYSVQGQLTRTESDGETIDLSYANDGKLTKRVRHTAMGKQEVTLFGGRLFEVRDGTLIKHVLIDGKRVARIGRSGQSSDTSLTAAQLAPGAPRGDDSTSLVLLFVVLVTGVIRSKRQQYRRGYGSMPNPRRLPRLVTCGGVGAVTVVALLVTSTCRQSKRGPQALDHWPDDCYALLTDHLGTVHLHVDAAGQVVAEQNALPYGVQRYAAGGLDAWQGYTGQRREGSSGLVRFGKRHYVPSIGQWTRPDPLYLHDPKTVLRRNNSNSIFSYTGNNPLSYLDLDGQQRARANDIILVAGYTRGPLRGWSTDTVCRT